MAVDIKLKRSHTHSNIPTTSDLSEGEFAVNTYDSKLYMRDGSNEIVTVANHYATNYESSTKTFYVTVATSASGHVHHGSGSSNKYKINGVFSPFLKLIPGITYRFDQTDSSNSGHPFRFYLDENKSTAYTTGVSYGSGSAGSANAYTEIVVTHSTPSILHYQCSAHGLMGWAAFVNTSNLTAFDTGDLTEGTNLYYTDARAQAVSINNVVEDTTPQLGGNLDVNAKNINFGDSASSSDDRLNFGAGTDLSIYHNGSHNRLDYSSNVYLNSGANVLTILSGDETYETKDFGISGSRTGTGGAIGRLRFINRAGSSTITDINSETKIEGWRINSNTPSLTFNFGGTERHRFDDNGKVALGAVPSSFGSITETVEITGTLKTTSTAKLTGVEVTGTISVSGNTTLSGTLNTHTIPSGTGTLALTSDITSSDVSADSTPQLGGNLDVNGNSIVSASNGNIAITPNGSGKVILDGLSHPVADGNAGQVLKTDGSGNLAFASVSSLAGSGIQNVSDDSSPQLGGNLDVVTHSIVSTSNRDINLTPNGSGKVVVSSTGIEFSDGSVQTAAGANQGFAIAMGIALG